MARKAAQRGRPPQAGSLQNDSERSSVARFRPPSLLAAAPRREVQRDPTGSAPCLRHCASAALLRGQSHANGLCRSLTPIVQHRHLLRPQVILRKEASMDDTPGPLFRSGARRHGLELNPSVERIRGVVGARADERLPRPGAVREHLLRQLRFLCREPVLRGREGGTRRPWSWRGSRPRGFRGRGPAGPLLVELSLRSRRVGRAGPPKPGQPAWRQ
jgi:hypothetical protein